MEKELGIKLENLTKIFYSRDGASVSALEGINITFEPKSFTCIIGPTGCGKTTLLRIIAGIEPPTSGKVILGEEVVTRPSKEIGMVFQQYSLFPWRNVIDNVAFGLELRGVPKKERLAQAKALLELVGLSQFAQSRPYELSGGMQQRVAIARALAQNPKVLLLDEPFGALDERTRHRLQDELLAIWEKTKKTILFVTHNIDEAVYLGERVVVMSHPPAGVIADIKITIPRPRNRMDKKFVEALLFIRMALEKAIEEGGKNEKGLNHLSHF
ncbi:MAG: ABC transporter ATP-binding protein [candidate division WOR-3 bacterium]